MYSARDTCEMLRSKAININDISVFHRFSGGNTILHMASFLGYSDIVSLLINNYADVNAVNSNGYTPLHSAVMHKGDTRKCIDILLKAGADPRIGAKKSSVTNSDVAIYITPADLAQVKSDHQLYQFLKAAEENFSDSEEKIIAQEATNSFKLIC